MPVCDYRSATELLTFHKLTYQRIRQSKRHNFVGCLTSEIASPSGGNCYELFAALFSHIGNWRSVRAGGQLCNPKFLAGARVKSSKTTVCRGSDEYQPSPCRNGSSKIGGAGFAV